MEGRLNIGCPTSSHREDAWFSFEVIDAASGVRFLEFEISAEDLALGIASRAHRSIIFKLHAEAIRRVGAKAEHKVVEITAPDSLRHVNDLNLKRGTPEAAPFEALVRPYETDGWRGELSDLQNGHRIVHRTKAGVTYRVAFFRHVMDGKGVE